MEQLSGNFSHDCAFFDRQLGAGKNYDILARNVHVGAHRGRIWCIDGYADDTTVERIIAFWLTLPHNAAASSVDDFIARFVTFDEVSHSAAAPELTTNVLSGKLLLLAEGIPEGIVIDAKTVPCRGVEEPGDSRVLRGAHDGFVEALVRNTALLRRRIRDPRLHLEGLKIGQKSQTDVVICYMEGLADEKLLRQLRQKLEGLLGQVGEVCRRDIQVR